MIITRRHLFTVPYFAQSPGFCRPHARAWASQRGMDFRAFLRNGIDEQLLLTTGDPFALALVRWAHESEGTAHG